MPSLLSYVKQPEEAILELLVPRDIDEGVHCWRHHKVQNWHHQVPGWGGDRGGLQGGKYSSPEEEGDHGQVREARGKGFVWSLLIWDPQHSPEDQYIGQHNGSKTPKCKTDANYKKPNFPESFFLSFAPLAKFSSNCALPFLIPSLCIWAVSLYSSQDTRPLFHCLCISFLHFSLRRRSLLSHAGLLLSLPDFIQVGIGSSCALRKMSLKSCQLCSAPLSLRGPDSILRLTRIHQDCKFHQGVITAAQAATSLDPSN
ncbi:hypothetical protein QYF61_009343 [Mycteria americana]|uniref:Uncharacterized protein n=1 Tax=Mycteria americana TaxID=33587 RepID=A0AAN7RRJ3_MYCAM|nr:hypothetical protein QYF61_009343 [Mycteria americana]